MKRVARRAKFDMATPLLAILTAACVLEPARGGTVQVDLRGVRQAHEVPLPSSAAEEGILLTKDFGRVAVEPHFARLPVAGYPDAVVAPPCAPTGARPVVVVLHGLGDRPEPHCEAWRAITDARAFVLCPRGAYDPARSTRESPRFTLAGGWALRAHVDAALASLAARYGPFVDTTRPLLSGFSLGAAEAALLAQADAGRFPRVAVLEGGLDVWGGPALDSYVSHGGRRVLFGCGSPWCPPPARAAATRIDAAGIGARIANADVGHHDAPPLQRALRHELSWFVDGDARWAPPSDEREP